MSLMPRGRVKAFFFGEFQTHFHRFRLISYDFRWDPYIDGASPGGPPEISHQGGTPLPGSMAIAPPGIPWPGSYRCRNVWNMCSTLIELDYGKIYRKALYLMVKTMVSCRFSLKPIRWYTERFKTMFCGSVSRLNRDCLIPKLMFNKILEKYS